MKASKIRQVEGHRLMKPDAPTRAPLHLRPQAPPRLPFLYLRTHPLVRFSDQPPDAPRTSMEAAFRSAGL